jgi:hypothetical protein
VIKFKIQDDNYLRNRIKWRSTVRAGSVMMEEYKLAQSEIGKITVAITANQHIFQFQVPKSQRNILYVSYYSTSEYYNTVQTLGSQSTMSLHVSGKKKRRV